MWLTSLKEKVVTVLGVKDELKRLQRMMERIKHVLLDAERKRIQSESVAGWVRELMYDADGVIDLCGHEGGKLIEGQTSTLSDSSTVCCSSPRLFSCFTSIRLNERLDEISRDMSGLNLTNLLVLNLILCSSLHSLPKGTTRLCNLRIIEVKMTELSFVPSGVGRLERLNHFNGFVVGGGGQGCSLEDLNPLEQLRVLEMYNLKEAVVAQKGRHVLGNKRHLKKLKLACTKKEWEDPPAAEYSEGEVRRIQDVFEELAPPPCLEKLDIVRYFGRQLPSWMMQPPSLGSLLPHLTSLYLYRCGNAVRLPPLGLLPELRYLAILFAEAVVPFGSEVFGSGSTPVLFPKLESLRLHGVANLQEGSFGRDYCVPKPNVLVCFGMPEIEITPWGPEGISLEGAGHPQLPKSRKDPSSSCTKRVVDLGGCPLLKNVEKLDSLERLVIRPQGMDFLAEGLLRLLQERQQHDNFHLVWSCDNLVLFSKCLMGGEYWPIIQNIPRVDASVFEGHDHYLRYTKEPYRYETDYR